MYEIPFKHTNIPIMRVPEGEERKVQKECLKIQWPKTSQNDKKKKNVNLHV